MAIIITDECISCGACEPECPNNAIYESEAPWSMSDGTSVKGDFRLRDGKVVDADAENDTLEEDYFFIVADKCTECIGFYGEPQCAKVCPVDCCVPNEDIVETEEELLAKKALLHAE